MSFRRLPFWIFRVASRRTGTVGAASAGRTGRGFTLTELLTTVAVGAILITVAIPSMRTFVQNSEVRSASDSLLAAIQQARSEAITRGDAVLLCRTADSTTDDCGTSSNEEWGRGWLMYVVTNFTSEVNYDNSSASHELIRRGPATPDGVTITSDDHGNNWLTFGPDGTLIETGTVAYAICDDRGEAEGRLIVIPMVGRPYVTDDMSAAPGCEPT